VYAYLPRIEGAFSQIEQWINAAGNDFFWQIISKDNTIDIFGKKEINRIYNPEDHNKIFEWLIEESIDAAGNKIKYAYKEENKDNVPDDIYQQGHSYNNRYIQSVKYGNFFDENEKEQFAFEILFDYGEYDLPGHNAGKITPSEPVREWAYRPDPFSSYRSGFEIRTCRLCRNILLIHHFENELGAPCLVKSVSAHYQQAGKYGKIDSGGLSIMKSIVLTGYIRKGSQAADQYETQEMPPLEFTFSQFKPPAAPEFKELKMNGHSIPGYLDNVNFQPVDLDSEGIPGLLYNDRNTILYLEPEGDGNYSKPKPPERFPVDRDFQSVSLVDLEGNGELELVVEDSTRAGFYQKENSGAWGNYRAFDSYPNDNSTPSMERADLDANGKTDLIQVRENNILVWPSKGKAGYAPATKVSRESELPLPKQEYKEEYVGFANIFGDGLSHRVKITRGSVECWPALGDGKFGEKITLGNAPAFEENFDIDRLFLTDIDGSGTADLVYVYDDRVELYLNRGGNSFSGAVTVSLPGQYSNTDRVGFSDVLGNGTTCLVFTKIAPDPKHYYYDFVGETIIGEKPQKSLKPYLLNQIDNNLGAVTRVQYCSSVKFYLEDKKAGRPWITKQHFPVQVVEEVISIDRVSGSRYTNRFKYHDGYYDTEERQFKGFGYVESWDTETFEEYAKNNGLQNVPVETVDPGLYVPPVYTRTWHHTGAIIREGVISRHYKDRYFQGDPHAHDFPDSILQPDIHTSDPETKRQAYAALSGSVMRREVYARAGGELEKNPYTVEESNFEVSLLQERADSEFAVFKVNPRESITYDYERDPADPRVEQEFTLEVDPHCGEITTSCAVILPRRPNSDPDITVYPEQQELKATAAYNSFINTPDRHGSRWRGVPCREQEFEIFGLDSEGKLYFSYDDLVPVKDAVKEPVPYEGDLDQGVLQARQLTWNRHFYWDEAQEAVLPAGEISSRALLHHSENAAFTKEFIAEVMGPRLSDHTIETHGGYIFDQETGYWWNKGLTQYYLEDAASFYMPAETMNSFADPSSSLYLKTKLEYDNYYLAPVKATEYLDEDEGMENVVSAEIDYVTFQPKQLIDINGNVSQALFDPLGQVIVTSLLGSENGEPIGGMRLYPYNGEPAEYEKQDDASFMAILEAPEKYLQGAASFFYYNLYAWQNDTQPVCSINLVRKDYYKTNRETTDFSCQTLIHYADGFGRDLEEKLETDPGKAFTRDAQLKLKRDKNNHPVDEYTAHRWIVSGKTVYNNKGEVCKEYLPYFSNTPLFESQQEIVEEGLVPPPTVTHYDPLTRVTRVDTPKGFFSKVEFNPWEEKHYDENDTVKDSEYYIKFMEEYPPEPTRELEDEKNALEKAAVFYDTPAIKVLDSRGMVFLDIQTNIEGANEEKRQLLSYYETDIQGRQTMSIDPRLYLSNQTKGTDYYNFKYRYIMGAVDPEEEEENTPVYTDSADGGVQKHFSNIFGNQLWSYSPRDYCQLISYDRLQRKSALRVKKISRQDEEPITSFDDFNLVEVFTYGESQSGANKNNLRGQLYELKDLSGIVTNSAYSMQESVLETSRQMAEDYKNPLN
ncbi:MAG: sugar-binding protein, partial [bacterium]|nr:sugar-binding protein [bacterium]